MLHCLLSSFFYIIWCHFCVYLRSKSERGTSTHYAYTPTQTATPAYYLAACCSVGWNIYTSYVTTECVFLYRDLLIKFKLWTLFFLSRFYQHTVAYIKLVAARKGRPAVKCVTVCCEEGEWHFPSLQKRIRSLYSIATRYECFWMWSSSKRYLKRQSALGWLPLDESLTSITYFNLKGIFEESQFCITLHKQKRIQDKPSEDHQWIQYSSCIIKALRPHTAPQ